MQTAGFSYFILLAYANQAENIQKLTDMRDKTLKSMWDTEKERSSGLHWLNERETYKIRTQEISTDTQDLRFHMTSGIGIPHAVD